MVFRDPEASLALAALGGLSGRGREVCKGHLMGSVRRRETGQLVHVQYVVTLYCAVVLPGTVVLHCSAAWYCCLVL